MIELSSGTLERFAEAEETVLVFFSHRGRGSWYLMEPVLARVASAFPHLKIGRVDLDRDPQSKSRWQVHRSPTILVLRTGALLLRIEGIHSFEELSSRMQKAVPRNLAGP